jgi:tRNA-dihydrouridine synthase 1
MRGLATVQGSHQLHGWDWWRSVGSPKYICAPMVDQSELAFRRLCRQLGTELGYSPMLHARLFNEVQVYRGLHFDPHLDDTPFIAQLAGHDPDTVLAAARHLEGHVSAVDLNFGCPQGIARKGRYGAFLLDEPDVMVSLVDKLASELSVPVTAKLRMLPDRADSIRLCKRLEEAGASAIALHGRTRDMKKQFAGAASWHAIKDAVDALGVPVIANGGIATKADVDACLEQTGAAAVMSSEALLENPALFCANRDPNSGEYLDQDELARRYLAVCGETPPAKGVSIVRGHLFKFLHNGLREHADLRDELLVAGGLSEMGAVCERLAARGWRKPNFHAGDSGEEDHTVSWYSRHRTSEAEEEAAAAAATPPPPRTREEMEAHALEKRARKQAENRRRRSRRRKGGRSGGDVAAGLGDATLV